MAKINIDGLNYGAYIAEDDAYYYKGNVKQTLVKADSQTNKDDIITGGNGTDFIQSGLGADTVSGGNGKDTIFGGVGDDIIYGDTEKKLDTSENGADTIYGGAGNDKIFGGNGADILYGDEQNAGNGNAAATAKITDNDNPDIDDGILDDYRDIIDGGNGGDTIVGGLGGDTLTGGAGPDIFVYHRITDSRSTHGEEDPQSPVTPTAADWQEATGDYITDFTKGQDTLDFTGLNNSNHGLHWTGSPATSGIWSLSVPAAGSTPAATYVFADADGDGRADVAIKVKGLVTFSADDFLGINDAPTITSNGGGATATVTVAENTTAVTDVNATDPDGDTLTYSILNTAGTDFAKFAIDSNGLLTFLTAPNFESPTDVGGADGDNSYVVDVQVSDGKGGFDVQTITVNVTNVDEVAPVFDSGTTATAIDENSGAGQVVYTAAATDPNEDGPSNPVTYSFGGGVDDALFTINSSTGKVTLTADPDDETKGSYSFDVTATDAAGNATTQTVTLEINDLDEVAPVFDSGTTATAIDENSGAGQVVYTAAATDPNEDGPSNPVTYSFGGGVDDALFTINSSTGKVTLTADPDDETKGSYSFDVTATDAAGNATTQTVTLEINDLDEVAPDFTSGTTASINENVADGTLIYTAAATDPSTDGGPHDPVTYSLGGTDASAFTIDTDTGAVTINSSPDYETKPSYSFTVTATDSVGNASDALTVTLNINDLNEAAPPANTAPVANDDVFAISDTTIGAGKITASWFTQNDTDGDGDPIYVTAVSGLPAGLTANFDLSGHLIDITGTTAAQVAPYILTYTLNGGDTGTASLKVFHTLNNSTGDNISDSDLEGTDFTYIDVQSGADSVTGDLVLTGNAGIDTFIGSAGDDTLNGGAGNDFLFGNGNNDTLIGGTGDDSLFGDDGTDSLSGNDGNDFLSGGNGVDTMDGGAGNDTLVGGDGDDILTGGAGADTFQFNSTSDRVDTINDFSVVDDTIALDNASFTALGLDGILAANAFHIGASATDADQRIIYDSTTGKLFYDSNGNAGGGSIQIAQLSTGLALTNNDILVI